MNEKLKEEITAYYKLIKNNTIEDAFVSIAQHFYKLALEDVKQDINKSLETERAIYNRLDEDADYRSGRIDAHENILFFINNLAK